MSIFLIASVSATDLNTTDEVISLDDDSNQVSVSEEGDVLSTNYSPTSFSEIQNAVDSAKDGDTIVLDGYYLFNSTVNVNKQLTFVGKNDATADGNNKVRLFTVDASKYIVFKDITFKNGFTDDRGAAICGGNDGTNTPKCSAVNCTFINNFADWGAGAIFWVNASDCTFKNNSATSFCGAMCTAKAVNCIFINNSAENGGALYSGSAVNCTFVSNSASYGGAMYGGSAVNCSFVDNSASTDGGASYRSNMANCLFDANFARNNGGAMREGSAVNCTFTNNYCDDGLSHGITSNMLSGGALCYSSAVNSIFINNTARDGGAIAYSDVINCSFKYNNVVQYGGAMYRGSAVNCSFVDNSANKNGGAMSGGSAVNCSFVDNSANKNGGAVSGGSVENSNFADNSANDNGGAMSGGSAVNCSFVGNSATNGGAVSGGSVENSNFADNSATNGGAVSGGSVENCTFVSNSASYGGAVYGCDVTNSTFRKNIASNFGGALFEGSAMNCSFEDNSAIKGGAMYGEEYAATNCIFTDNAAIDGGACYNINAVNCEFSNNNASENGGAMFGGTAIKCSFSSNHADGDGGALNDVYVAHSIFEYNTAGNNGGAMNGIKATNCTFNNNKANNFGGAVSNSIVSSNSKFNNNLANQDNDMYSSSILDSYSLSDLNAIINGNNFSEIYLNHDYTFDYTLDYFLSDGIVINKSVIIYGNSFTIDGNMGNIFSVVNGSVIFKNILFVNACKAINGVCTVVNCSFVNNSGAVSGGSCVNCSFVNNTRAMSDGSCVNCSFVNNTRAMSDGSAVNCIFANNSAYNGGAIYFVSAQNCTFINNSASCSGGAMYGGDAVGCLFEKNHVYISGSSYSDWGGGAINRGSAINCTFIDNSAKYGGAITLGIATNCTFVNNYADSYGGAMRDSSAVNCSFVNNSADSVGGAMYGGSAIDCTFFSNSGRAMAGGSAENCIFINNTGGAMSGGSALNSIFINNTANSGGAMSSGSAVNCTFINNTAYFDGGYMGGGGALAYSTAVNCTFINNSANSYTWSNSGGGAIYRGNAINCTFISNIACYGGAINSANQVENCIFVNNSAVDCGGAIFGNYDSSSFCMIKNSTFINNSAEYGGAISNSYSVEKCNFDNNCATYGGAIYGIYEIYTSTGYNQGYWTKYVININSSSFVNNSASYGGAVHDGNVSNCTFNSNHADYHGGAIYWSYAANITSSSFIRCTSDEDNTCLAYNSTQIGYEVNDCIFDVNPSNVDYHYISNLTSSNLTFFNGENEILAANLSEVRGKLAGKTVIFTINSNNYDVITDENGVAYFDVNNYVKKGGIYNVTISYAGDEIITPASVNVTVTINVHESLLNVSDEIEIYKNQYGSVSVNLYNIRGPLSDKTLIFNLKGITSKTIKTNSNGGVDFNIINYIDTMGQYDIEIIFEGDDYNQPVSRNITVYYIEYGANLTCSVDGKYFNDTIMTLSLINTKNKKPISNAPLKLEFSNGVVVGLTTDVDGIAKYRIPFNPDTYDVVASVNETYVRVNNVTVSGIEINKIFGEIEHYLTNDNRTLNFRLYNSYNSDVFRNVRIKLVFNNGNETEIITGDDGVASYDMQFPKGVYSVQASVTGAFNDFDDDYVGNIVLSNLYNCSVNFTNEIVFDFGGYGSTNFTIEGGIIEANNIHVIDHSEAIISLKDNVITVFGLNAGNYTLFVETTPDDYHNQINYTLNITVNKIDPKVSFSADIIFDYGGSGSIYVTVDGGSISRENICIVGYPDADINFTGNVITVSGLDVGRYNLTVTTTPEKDYNALTASVMFTIKEVDSDVIFSNEIEFTQGESGSTEVTFVGCEEDFGVISVVNHPEAIIDYANNVITVSGLTFGDYVLRVDTNPDKNHKAVSRSVNLTVLKLLSSVVFDEDDVVFDYGNSGYTKMSVSGGVVKSSDISVVDHPEAVISMSNNNGVSVSNLDAGNYTLHVVTTPDDSHRAVEATVGVVVNKVKSSVSFNDNLLSYDYGDLGSTTVIVNGGDISKVTISIIGHPYAKITLVDNLITISDLDAGNYKLQVDTIPDSNHISVTNYVDVEVSKAKSKVSFTNDVKFDYGGMDSTTLILDGCSVSLSNISVLNHPEAVIGINNNNVVSVSGLDAGSYTLQVVTTPDSNHDSVTGTVDVTVRKVNSSVAFSNDVKFDYGGVGSTTLTVVGGSVTKEGICVLNHPEAVMGINNNVVSVSGLDVGSYTLQVVTAPDSNHESVTGTVDVTVSKVDSIISFNKDIMSFDYGDSATVGVNVSGAILSDMGISVLNHKEAIISLKDNIISVSGLNAGSYTLQVVTTPDSNHNSVTKILTVNVNKVDSSVKFNDNLIAFGYGSSGSIGVSVIGGSISYDGICILNHNESKINWENNIVSVSNLNVGNYTLKVTTTPDSNHNSVSESVTVIVSKVDSSVAFSNDVKFDYGGVGSTTLTIVGGSVTKEDICVLNHPEAAIGFNNNVVSVSGLDVGSYTLQVVTTPDSNHNEVSETIGIVVNKVDSSVSFSNPVASVYGSVGSTTLTVVGGSVAEEGISISNHPEAKITLNNNVVSVSGLDVGSYTLQVVTTPDPNHNSVKKTLAVNVNKADSSLSFDSNAIVFNYGDVGSVGVNVTGGIISDSKINILNHPEAKITINGDVVSVSGLGAGSYTLNVSTTPDSNHNSVTKSLIVNVNRIDSSLQFNGDVIAFNYGSSGSIGITIDGGSISYDGISVVGHNESKISWENNIVSVSNLNVGNYTLKVTTAPDSNHNSISKSIGIVVSKAKSKIGYANDIVFDYLGVGTTTLILDGCSVSNDDMEIVGYPDAKVSISPSNVVSVSGLDSGKYTLKISNIPDSNHIANTVTIPVSVNKINSKISFTNDVISFRYAESGSTPIVLENCKVANMSIVGHEDVQPVLEDNVISVSSLAVGNYLLKVTTSPDDNYKSVDAYINVTVSKNAATITVKKSQTVAYKKSTNWAITLKDSNGKPVSGVKVHLKIYKGNKLYKTVTNLKLTDANGVTNYNTKGLPVGKYKFVVSVSHDGYNVKSVSTPVKVIKQTAVKIIINTKADKKGAVISIIVKDKAGKKYLNNIKLKLSIKNGKTYTNVNLISGNYKSGKGVCAYSTNMLTVGSHAIKVVTTDIKYSGSASKNVKVLASAKKYRNWWEKISKGKKTSYGT